MNVTTFRLENAECIPEGEQEFGAQQAIYRIPTLPAYALIDSHLTLDGDPHIDIARSPATYRLNNDAVEVPNRHWNILGAPTGLFTIYHNGIKDFELLFPHINEASLRTRIGEICKHCYEPKS